jgi:hypothetical protein
VKVTYCSGLWCKLGVAAISAAVAVSISRLIRGGVNGFV